MIFICISILVAAIVVAFALFEVRDAIDELRDILRRGGF